MNPQKCAVLIASLFTLNGCAEDPGSVQELNSNVAQGERAPGDQSGEAAAAPTPPDTLVNPDGTTWHKIGKIKFSQNKLADVVRNAPEPAGEDLDVRIGRMTVEEAAKFLHPRGKIGDYEFRLSDKDALALAVKVQANIRKGTPVKDARGPDGLPIAVDKKIIPGYGDWTRSNNIAHQQPHIMVGALQNSCTAFKIENQHTAGTAAHCLMDSSDNWYPQVDLRFGAGSSNTAGGGTNQAMNTLPSWCYWTEVPACYTGVGTCDFAAISLHGYGGASCNFNDYAVGWFGSDAAGTTNVPTRIGSYPGTPPSGGYRVLAASVRESVPARS